MFKNTLRQRLEKILPNSDVSRWFDPLEINVDEQKRVITVTFPHLYFGNWFALNIQKDFERQASNMAAGMDIVYANSGTSIFSPALVPAKAAQERNRAQRHTADDFTGPTAELSSLSLPVPEKYTFSSFIVNKKNDFPIAAAKECVKKRHTPPYFPLVIYGQSGSGKSHFLAAMANALLEESDMPVYFGNVGVLENISAPLCTYPDIANCCIFIDDAQRTAESRHTQDALSALIDAYKTTGKLLVLSFDRHPSTASDLDEKLKSRLSSGLVVELKKPDLDIRRQYAQRKNDELSLDLTKEQILSLAQRYQDIRSIDGALTRLTAYKTLLPEATGDTARQDVAAILARGTEESVITPSSIILSVAKHYGISPEDVSGKSREKIATEARHIAILLCRELLGLSLVQIGRAFSGRDHSSVLYSIKKIKELQQSNNDMNKKVELLRKLCLTGHH